LFFCLIFLFCVSGAQDSPNLMSNGDFSSGFTDWLPFWTREPDTGKATLAPQVYHQSSPAIKIDFRGIQDWGLVYQAIPVKPGEAYTYRLFVKTGGRPKIDLSIAVFDPQNNVVNWNYVQTPLTAFSGWQELKADFTVPAGIAFVRPRLIGIGPVELWADDFSLTVLPIQV